MVTIEQAREMLKAVRLKESKASSDYNRYKTEEYNNILKKVKAERRKVVKLCKEVGMNVSPFGVEQPEGAPQWIKKKYRTQEYYDALNTISPEAMETADKTIEKSPEESEELEKYSRFLEFLKSNEVITEEVEKKAYDLISEKLKSSEQEFRKHEETLRKLMEIGSMSQSEYDTYLKALKESVYKL